MSMKMQVVKLPVPPSNDDANDYNDDDHYDDDDNEHTNYDYNYYDD